MIADLIPSTVERPENPTASSVVARIMAIRPSRRALLKGLFIAGAAAVLTPIEWWYTKREAWADGPTTEHMTCVPASYDKIPNNWWEDGLRVCTGGWRIGSFPCVDGWHREGRFRHDDERYVSHRSADSCGGLNAWRWAGGFRCSDAWTTTTWRDGDEYSAPTIGACKL